MPWHIVTVNGRACVALQGQNTPIPGGCHDTRGEAERHMAALYANNPEARTAAATEPLTEVAPIPDYAPASWFEQPDWIDEWRAEHGAGSDRVAGLRRLTVTDEGRVGGWFYPAGACIFGSGGEACPKPSPTNYAAFHQQDCVLDDGSMILVGAIGNSAGHVDRNMPLRQALDVYNNPKIQLMRVRAGDSEEGGWVAGSLVPAGARVAAGVDPLTWGSLNFLRSCALSGSWYPTAPGGFDKSWWERNQVPEAVAAAAEWYDSIGPQLVTRPALALMRSVQVAAVEKPIIVGGWGGVAYDPDDECAECAEEVTVGANESTTGAGGGGGSTTAGGGGGGLSTSLTITDGQVREVLTAALQPLEERLTAIEEQRARESEAAEAEGLAALRARAAAIPPVELPAPEGFADTPLTAWTPSMVRQAGMTDAAWSAAAMTSGSINDLPDSAFAYIEPGGKKDAAGKTTPRSLRHFPIHDEAHVRNALARAPQSPFGDKAMPKITAAAKRMGIGQPAAKAKSAA